MMAIKNLKPNCSHREDGMLVCQPEFEQDGKRIAASRPMELKLDGDRAIIIDSGDLNQEAMAAVKRHIEENVL